MPSILWSFVLALHLLCMAYWVGGGISTIISARAGTALLEGAQRQTALLQIYFRYCRGLLHVAAVALITGWGLIFRLGGFAVVPWQINAMQVLGLIMAALALATFLGPIRSARRAIRAQPGTFDTIRNRIVIMVAIGILTTLCASLARI